MGTLRIAIAASILAALISPAVDAGRQPASPHDAIPAAAREAISDPDRQPARIEAWYADFPATTDIAGGRVFAETPDQVQDARWALGRFAAAGLELPEVEFWMHADRVSCDPRREVPPVAFVMIRDGRSIVFSCGTRFTLLHELGHIFGAAHFDDAQRDAFTAMRDADGWRADEWARSADEHLADVIAWGLHPDHVRPSRTKPNDDASLAAAFEFATGTVPLDDI